MSPSSLDKQAASYNSPNDWLMSLAMDLVALCDSYVVGENGTDGLHLAVFTVDVALPVTSWLPACPLPYYPIEVLVVLATPVRKLSKMVEIQLAIHSILCE